MLKLSQFTTILPYEGNALLFNSFTDHYILVKPLLRQLLEAAVSTDDISGLKDYHPAFFEELFKHGFFVEKTTDEVEAVRRVSKKVDTDTSRYLLTINPTMGCNFKCWYCYETHLQGSKMAGDTIENVLRFVQREKEENETLRYFSMSFFGGEPLIYYDQVVVPLLKGAKSIFEHSNIVFASSFTTNGYLLNQAKIDFLKDHFVGGMQITLDGSEAFHDKVRYVNSSKGSYRKIISNIKLLAKNGLQVTMRINFTRDNFISCMDICDDFDDLKKVYKKNILVDFHQVWQDEEGGTVSTIPATEKFVNAGFGIRAKATNLNNVVDSCYADKNNSATINFNGEVFKCTARDFTSENSLGKLNNDGSITWKEEYIKRQNAKFHNPPCFQCKIMPLCNGGCSQHAYEHLDDENGYCVFGFDEYKKDEIILERFRLKVS